MVYYLIRVKFGKSIINKSVVRERVSAYAVTDLKKRGIIHFGFGETNF